MNKQEGTKTRYYVQWDTHARHMCTVLCSLMEHQSLVDLAVCCGTNTIHAHKCVLAANSPYFREQLEKNTGTEQVVITGLDFTVVKSIVEFMYCGETNILDENLKYMIAAAKFFQMRGLQTLVSDHQDIRFEADSIHIPPPIFLPKKPKYPNAYRPLNNSVPPANFNSFKNPIPNDPYMHRKIKRKYVRSEAEKACAKEAAASRLALEALQKELANTTQMSSFVIEESCTETTVENFIPHSEETYIENINHIENVPLQVVNYNDLNNSLLSTSQIINIDKPQCTNNMLQYGIQTNSTKDKLKRMLGTDIPGNVEIMFRTSDGNFVNVTDDVLQNLSGGTLQYQIVDENGQVGEIRELQVQEQNNPSSANYEGPRNAPMLDSSLTQQPSDTEPFVSTQNEDFVQCTNLDLPNYQENTDNNQNGDCVNNKSETTEESQVINFCIKENSQNQNSGIVASDIILDDGIINTISSSSSNSSPGKTSNNSSTDSKIDETDTFIDALNKSVETPNQIDDDVTFVDCSTIQFVDPTAIEENKENIYIPEMPFKDNKNIPIKKSIFGVRKSSDNSDLSDGYKSELREDRTDVQSTEIWKSNTETEVGSTGDNFLNIHSINLEEDENKDGSGDYEVSLKRSKISELSGSTESEEEHWHMLEDAQILYTYSPRKTRSSLKMNEDIASQIIPNQHKDVIEDNSVSNVKCDKPRRIMPNRKKKSN